MPDCKLGLTTGEKKSLEAGWKYKHVEAIKSQKENEKSENNNKKVAEPSAVHRVGLLVSGAQIRG